MPYARRDPDGHIVALSDHASGECAEQLPAGHPEVQSFLRRMEVDRLAESDRGFIRVLDDLIELLIARNVIRFTDLPRVAQEKLLARQQLREALRPPLDLLPEDEGDGLV